MAPRKKVKPRDIADRMAGDLVRSRGRCELAGLDQITCKGVLQWAHIVGRGNHRLRHELWNALCLCQAHHVTYTYKTWEWVHVIHRNFPDSYHLINEHIAEPFEGDYTKIINRLEPEWTQLQKQKTSSTSH